MLKIIILLSILLTLIGCMKNYKSSEIQLVTFEQDPPHYNITFLSDTDFSTRETSRSTGSYVHCINSRKIYNDEYIPDYSTNYYLAGNIPKDVKPPIDKNLNRYIYNVSFEQSSKINYNETIYCRVFTGSFLGKLKKSQVFKLI